MGGKTTEIDFANGTCDANIGEAGPDFWTYQRCGKPAVRILNEYVGQFMYRCKKHLEEMRKCSRIATEEILVRKQEK